MKKLHEVLQTKLLPGLIGIEIECEGRKLSVIDSDTWRTEDDGSLRGNFPDERAEFVLKQPIHHKDVGAALDELINAQKAAKFTFSFRTSVHIHINCGDLTADQLSTFAYSYLLFERILMRYCGEERNANRFCLRLRDAENQLDPLKMLIESGLPAVYHLHGDRIRYASMNLASLAKYGSIEFRGMRGNMDKQILTTWIDSLVSLRKYALQFNSPMELYSAVANSHFPMLFEKVFPTTHKELAYVGMDRDFLEGVSLSIEIPFEWRRFAKMREEAPKANAKYKLNPNALAWPAAQPLGNVVYANEVEARADARRIQEIEAVRQRIQAHAARAVPRRPGGDIILDELAEQQEHHDDQF